MQTRALRMATPLVLLELPRRPCLSCSTRTPLLANHLHRHPALVCHHHPYQSTIRLPTCLPTNHRCPCELILRICYRQSWTGPWKLVNSFLPCRVPVNKPLKTTLEAPVLAAALHKRSNCCCHISRWVVVVATRTTKRTREKMTTSYQMREKTKLKTLSLGTKGFFSYSFLPCITPTYQNESCI